MSRTQPEARIVAAILRRLNAAPGTHARKTHGNAYSVGWPDIIGCSDGRMIAIEVKQPGKKATPRQVHELAKWEAAGARVGVATSVAEAEDIVWPRVTLSVGNTPDDGSPRTFLPGGIVTGPQPMLYDPAEPIMRPGWSIQ